MLFFYSFQCMNNPILQRHQVNEFYLGEAACRQGERNTSHFLPIAFTLCVDLGPTTKVPLISDSETSLEGRGLEKPCGRLLKILWELRNWLYAFYTFIVFGCQGHISWQESFVRGRALIINYWLHMSYCLCKLYNSHIRNTACWLRSS